MHFYIDESGHTGPNLFDSDQPSLYYGLLSSKLNVDVLAEASIRKLRLQAGVQRLHAAELGNGGLVAIADGVAALAKKLALRFDIYRVAKADHAIISFFDQVFDHGVNPATNWNHYWTPLRYVLLLKVGHLFDEDLTRKAWEARIEANDSKSNALVVEVCQGLSSKLNRLPDVRSREIIGGALAWAAANPGELGYNAKSKYDRLSVMPNIIGFHFVMLGIAERLKAARLKAARIVVDQQSQFNRAQNTLHGHFVTASKIGTLESGNGMPRANFQGIPDIPIEFRSGASSYGLELVDIYLWIFKRLMEGKEVAPELVRMIKPQLQSAKTDEISLAAIANRWKPIIDALPELTLAQKQLFSENFNIMESQRLRALAELTY